jgi:hypothetical protein
VRTKANCINVEGVVCCRSELKRDEQSGHDDDDDAEHNRAH